MNGVFVDVNYSMMYFERWWWSPLETAFRRYKRPEELAESFCEFREERIKLFEEGPMQGLLLCFFCLLAGMTTRRMNFIMEIKGLPFLLDQSTRSNFK